MSSDSLKKKDQCDIITKDQGIDKEDDSSTKENKSQSEQKKCVVNFFKLYKQAQSLDFFLIFVGFLLSVAAGCGLPFFAVVAGEMVDAFNQVNDEMIDKTENARNLFLLIGAGTFVAGLLSVIVWMKVGERVSIKCRKLYLVKILQQGQLFNIKRHEDQQLTQKIENDFLALRQAVGFKVGTFVFIAASLVAGGRNAISTGWLLSVIMVSTLPLLGISGVLYTFLLQLKRTKLLQQYQPAEQKSKKVIYNLSSVKLLTGQKHQIKLYSQMCSLLRNKVIAYSSLVGLGAGWFSLVQFGVYALAFWFGSHCVEGTYPCQSNDQNDKYTPGAVIVIFFAFYVRLDSMQQILPTLRKIYAGMQAAYRIYEVIEEKEKTQHQYDVIGNEIKGIIQFRNVNLYDKPDKTKMILEDVSFRIDSRFVGFCGNNAQISAILDLITGVCIPQTGRVLIDGVEMKRFNYYQLRGILGYIDDRSGLWETTIRKNLTLDDQISNESIFQVLRQLQIEQTVKLYQHQLETLVGYQGGFLDYTVGRKLLIARLLLRKPKIIVVGGILNEEKQIEEFNLFMKMVELSPKTTCFVYCGKNLRIMQHMEKIYVFKQGKIVEQSFNQSKQPQISPFVKQEFNLGKYPAATQSPNHYFSQIPQSPQQSQIAIQKSNLKLYKNQIIRRLLLYIKPHKFLYCLGLLFSLLSGLLYPIFTIFLADILLQTFKFSNQPYQSSFIRDNIEKPVLVIVYIGLSALVFNFLENAVFSVVAEKIVQKIRLEEYQKILHLPMNWFQQSPMNSPFKVHQGLKQNAISMSSILTSLFPILFKNMVSTIAGLIIAFVFEWRSALLGVLILPMMMAAGFLLMKFFFENDYRTKNKYKKASSIFSECTQNARYLHAFDTETLIEQLYDKKLKECIQSSFKRSIIVGVRFGFSQFLIFLSFALMFYFGSLFLKNNPDSVTVLSLFTAIFAVIWPGWTSGSNFFRAPDLVMAKKASVNHFLIDSIDEKELQIKQNSKFLKTEIKGSIQFRCIGMSCLQKHNILSNLNLRIQAKEKVAILGSDSNIFKLLTDLILRLKPIEQGDILIDGVSIKDYDIQYLRSQICVIDSNPFIFEGTIRQNIIYNMEDVSQQDLIKACCDVNLFEALEEVEKDQNINDSNQVYLQKNEENYSILLQTFLAQNQKISSSLRQQIALSRIFLKKPKIIFLHFNNEDSTIQFDKKLWQSIEKISEDITIIFQTKDYNFSSKPNKFLRWQSGQIRQTKNSFVINKDENLNFFQDLIRKLY